MHAVQKVMLPNNTVVYVRIVRDALDPEKPVGALSRIPKLDEIGKTIAGISQAVRAGLQGVAVNAVTVDFGLEIGFESGELMSLFAKASGSADLHVKLELSMNDHSQ